MLDRIGVGQDPVEWRPSRKASNRGLQNGPEARNEVIANPCHWHDFPPSPGTPWELTQTWIEWSVNPHQR